MSRQKNSMLINEYALNRETFSLIQFQSCFIIKRNIKSPTLMSRINDLNTIRESGLYGGSNDFISAKLGILICISYDYKREKNMLMLTSSPALSTQGRVDQISDKVSLLMEGIVNQASLLRQIKRRTMHQRPTTFTDFYFILLLLFFNLAPFWRDVATDETYGTDHKKQFSNGYTNGLSSSLPGSSEKSTLLCG